MTSLLILYALIGMATSYIVWWFNHEPCPFCDSCQREIGAFAIAVSGVLWPLTVATTVWCLFSDRGKP